MKLNNKSKSNRYVLSRGNEDFYVVVAKDLKNIPRNIALSMCAATWIDLHRLLKKSAEIGEELYISNGKIKIKIVDGMLNALSKLDALHPSLIYQVREMNLSQNGFKVNGC